MAGVKISALPAIPVSVQLTDIYPTVQAGVTYKATIQNLLTTIQSNIQIAESQVTNLVSDLASKLNLSGGTMSGIINMGGFQINAVADPTSAQDCATKNYVDNIATGGGAPVVAASTTALTVTYSNGTSGVGATLTNAGAQATFSLDGQSPTVGQRVLIKNQTGGSNIQNGVYTVTNVGSNSTNWVLTRASDYDTPADINDTGVIPVSAGTVNANTGWINTTLMVAVGTTAVTFVQFGVSFPVSLANGGTGASLTASNGGIFYSTGSVGAILAGTSTANQVLLSGSSAAPSWSTATYPATTTINQLLYSSSANVITGVSVVNSAVLTTTSGGVPTWVAYTGTGSPVLATSPSLTTPTLGVAAATSINFGDTALSKYKQGTFTPALTGSSVNPTSVTYSSQIGEYTQIGNIVYYYARVTVSALTIGSAAGNLQITGLPVASVSTSNQSTVGSCTCVNVSTTSSYSQVNSWISPNSSVINIVKTQVAAANSGNTLCAITEITATTDIIVQGYYFTS